MTIFLEINLPLTNVPCYFEISLGRMELSLVTTILAKILYIQLHRLMAGKSEKDFGPEDLGTKAIREEVKARDISPP